MTSFLDNKLYVLLDRQYYKEKNFYLTQAKVYTDSNFLTTNFKQEVSSYAYENTYDENDIKLAGVTNTTIFAAIYLRSNSIAKHHYRSSQKISKYVSYIGGFWSILYFFFKIVGKLYNTQKTNMKIANKLYDFKDCNSASKEKQNLINVKKPLKFSTKLPVSSSIKIGMSVKIGNKTQNEESNPTTFTQKIMKLMELQKGLKILNDCSYLFFYCRRRKTNTIKETQKILRKKAKFAMEKDLDIVHLLKKMNSFEKLQMVIFNKDQRFLFDFFDKITINAQNDDHLKGRSTQIFMNNSINMKYSAAEENIKDYNKLFKSYMAVKKDETDSIKLNSKILSQVKPELREIFEAEANLVV